MKRTLLTTFILLGAFGAALAQQRDRSGPYPGHAPGGMMGAHLAEFGLFPPDFVLSNQTALGLSDEQILSITKDIGATHDRSSSIRDTLRPLAEQLHGMLEKSEIDEAAALAIASQVNDLEKQIKLTHLGLMIRVKNALTPAQQEKLKTLRPPRPERTDRRGPPPPNPQESY
jgi:Spy/CpxP family protein refolding chaperone